MNLFKQSTAASRIVGPALDSTGAEYASLVIGDLSISKNGGTLTAMAAAATLTYIANGYYTLALITGNTDTVGTVQIICNKATYQMPPHIGTVLVAAAFDVLVTNGTIASVSNITAATGIVLSGVTHTGAVIPTVSAVTGLTAANLDASISSRMATYTQPTGFLAAAFPATVSSLDAASTRTALGLASANLDTRITGVNTNIANMQQATILNNTARSNFPFEMVLLDGTAATGITVTGARSLDGAAYAAVSGTISEVGSGTYSFNASAADTNGGGIMWKFSGTGCKDTLVGFVTSI
jgi:hypothetical protein